MRIKGTFISKIRPRHTKTCPRAYAESKDPDQHVDLQADQGLAFPPSESLDTTECMNGEQIPRYDLNLRVLRMFEGTFSLGDPQLENPVLLHFILL